MKAISLWQPWASLMAVGAKRFETRSWSTKYRGPLAIHAAKRFQRHERELCGFEVFRLALEAGGYESPDDLPLGALVAVVDLTDVLPTAPTLFEGFTFSARELTFGDYTPGRFAWKTENLRRLETPIPFRGAQGLFEVPPPP
ncbi:MAG: ASCH domain-containing protein [Gammaproteobacteria bacterium]|nr:ASCH domain-containing protein [Gammaproteobacteria bacterium]